jgi:hypothetical protein
VQILRKFYRSVPRASERPPQPIEVDGVLLGAAIAHALGVRFVAADARVSEMDQSIWPNVAHAFHSARQLFKSGARLSAVRVRRGASERDMTLSACIGRLTRRIAAIS